MIAKTLSAAAVIALAGTAHGQFLTQPHTSTGMKVAPSEVGTAPTARGVSTGFVPFDITGVTTFELIGGAGNTVILLDVGTASGVPGGPIDVIGVDFDVVQTSIGASWGSEMIIGMGPNGGGVEIGFRTSLTGAPVAAEANSSPYLDFVDDFAASNIHLPDGILRLEFFETYLDNGGTGDGMWDSGTVNFHVPTPGAAGLLAVAGVGALRRKRR